MLFLFLLLYIAHAGPLDDGQERHIDPRKSPVGLANGVALEHSEGGLELLLVVVEIRVDHHGERIGQVPESPYYNMYLNQVGNLDPMYDGLIPSCLLYSRSNLWD